MTLRSFRSNAPSGSASTARYQTQQPIHLQGLAPNKTRRRLNASICRLVLPEETKSTHRFRPLPADESARNRTQNEIETELCSLRTVKNQKSTRGPGTS